MLKRTSALAYPCTLALVAAACGSSSNQTSSNMPATTDITYMAWYNNTSEISTTQGTLDQYNNSQSGVHVNLISADRTTYEQQLDSRSSSNALPDTAMEAESQVITWALAGKLADVSDLYQTDKPLPQLAFTYQGRTVAYSEANEVIVLYYDRKAFDDAGLPYPPADAASAWTWDQFVTVAKQLTKDQNGLTPNDAGFDPTHIVRYGGDFNRLPYIWPVMAVSNGGGVVSTDGKTVLLNAPETAQAAQAIADLQNVDHVTEDYTSWSNDLQNLDQLFLNGKYAMMVSGQWEISVSLGRSLAANPNYYGVGVLPMWKTAVTYNTGGTNVMFNTTKNPDSGKQWLKWYADENNNLSNIQSGLWMPILQKWYTDDSLIKLWADNPWHPPLAEYKSAVIDYAVNNAVQMPWYYTPGYDQIDTILTNGMAPVWNGTKTAADALANDIAPQVQQVLTTNNP